jgi:hypothetical protein
LVVVAVRAPVAAVVIMAVWLAVIVQASKAVVEVLHTG